MIIEETFPSDVELTEEELVSTLVEFHQRNSRDRVGGPPPPFEITSTVMQTQPSALPPPGKVEEPPLIVGNQALVAVENEVEFRANATWFGPNEFGHQPAEFFFDFFVRGHNPGKVPRGPVYIRTYQTQWQPEHQGFTRCSPPQPVTGGPVVVAFNGSTFNIPPRDSNNELYIQVHCYLYNWPNCPGVTLLGYLYVPMFVEYEDGEDMEHIYGENSMQHFLWYNAPPRSIVARCSFLF